MIGRYGDLLSKYVVDANGCWIWQAALDRHGYGRVRLKERYTGAHRAIFELLRGPIPEGLDLDHLCRVTACVNPDHLEPVTRSENLLRGAAVRAKAKTHCARGHELAEGRVYRRTAHSKQCKVCKSEYDAARYAARKGRAA